MAGTQMEIDLDKLGTTRVLTKEETAELYKVRTATPEQLLVMAGKCDIVARLVDGIVVIADANNTTWNPRGVLYQNHALLAAVISQGDCRLLYDDGINEFFIYQFRHNGANGDGPPLANKTELNDTVFQAAMNLWFPEE